MRRNRRHSIDSLRQPIFLGEARVWDRLNQTHTLASSSKVRGQEQDLRQGDPLVLTDEGSNSSHERVVPTRDVLKGGGQTASQSEDMTSFHLALEEAQSHIQVLANVTKDISIQSSVQPSNTSCDIQQGTAKNEYDGPKQVHSSLDGGSERKRLQEVAEKLKRCEEEEEHILFMIHEIRDRVRVVEERAKAKVIFLENSLSKLQSLLYDEEKRHLTTQSLLKEEEQRRRQTEKRAEDAEKRCLRWQEVSKELQERANILAEQSERLQCEITNSNAGTVSNDSSRN